MKNIGQMIGGILAMIGGAMTFGAAFYLLPYLSSVPRVITFIVSLTLGILAIVGGLLIILDKSVKIGGILATIAGTMLIVGLWIDIAPFVPLAVHLAMITGIGFYLDPLLAIVGGILGLVFSKQQK